MGLVDPPAVVVEAAAGEVRSAACLMAGTLAGNMSLQGHRVRGVKA